MLWPINGEGKKKIETLNGPSGPITDTNGMLLIASDFYKKLFGKEDRLNIGLGSDFWDSDETLTSVEREDLEKPFT